MSHVLKSAYIQRMSYVLALDQGTTSSRAIIFDAEGTIVGTAQQEITQIYPQPGWVEHDPVEIRDSQIGVARRVLQNCGLTYRDILAIGITNQRETTVVWDRNTGRPLHNAIVWQDRRTMDLCESLRADGHESVFQERTGLLLDPYFSGTKVRWLLDHVDGARARAERGELAFGTVDAWLIWNLIARHCTDPSNASRTLLYNLHTGDWDQDLCNILEVPVSLLPGLVASSGILGRTELLGGSIPVASIAGDQQAALFGQVCTRAGMVKNTYGTGCFLLMNTGAEPVHSRNRLLTTLAWQTSSGTQYALEGSVFVGGAVVQWLRDGLGLIQASHEVESLAAQVPDADGVMIVPAFTGLGAPYWDPRARGTVVGLTRGSSAAHLARAALESIAFQSAEVMHAMESDAGVALSEVRVDGGATANNLLMQFQADLLGVPVVRPVVRETTALGAAYLAGLATGQWNSVQDIAGLWQIDCTFEPQISRDAAGARMDGWKRAVERSRNWHR